VSGREPDKKAHTKILLFSKMKRVEISIKFYALPVIVIDIQRQVVRVATKFEFFDRKIVGNCTSGNNSIEAIKTLFTLFTL
jgi:hypothetical protein